MIINTESKEKLMKLREKGNYGLMDCFKALMFNKWDVEKAYKYLRSGELNNDKLIDWKETQ